MISRNYAPSRPQISDFMLSQDYKKSHPSLVDCQLEISRYKNSKRIFASKTI